MSLFSLTSLHGRRLEALDGVPALTFAWDKLSARRRRGFLESIFSGWDGREAYGGLVHCEPEFTWTSDVITPFGLLDVAPTTRKWKFVGTDCHPRFGTLLLFDRKSSRVLGLEVEDGVAPMVDHPHELAGHLDELHLRVFDKRNVEARAVACDAINTVRHALSQLSTCRDATKAKALTAKCNAAVAKLERAVDGSPELSKHPEISRSSLRYAGFVKAMQWDEEARRLTEREALFFESRAPAATYDGWMEG